MSEAAEPPPGGSLAFDRAAEYYDETRAIGPVAIDRTIDLLEGELTRRGRVLEVGVGTGLLALPLAARGVPVGGVAQSIPMMHKLVDKSGGRSPVLLAQADATRLPFRDDTFGGAYARWVLHLIPGWRDTVTELCRVVRPGSPILIVAGGNQGAWEAMQARLQAITGGDMGPVGLDVRDGYDELDAAFRARGATFRALPERIVAVAEPLTVQGFFHRVERRIYSWTWGVSDEDLRRAVAEVRPWAEARWGSLDAPLDRAHPMRWRAYDLG